MNFRVFSNFLTLWSSRVVIRTVTVRITTMLDKVLAIDGKALSDAKINMLTRFLGRFAIDVHGVTFFLRGAQHKFTPL